MAAARKPIQALLSKPPAAPARAKPTNQFHGVSPGVWKDTKTGQLINSATDPNKAAGHVSGATQDQKAAAGGVVQRKDKFAGLNNVQNAFVNKQFGADNYLIDQQNAMLPGISQDMERDVYAGLQPIPGAEGADAWRTSQIDKTAQEFEKRNAPIFKQRKADLAQDLYNRGIPLGSDLYKQQMADLDQQENDARNASQVAAEGIAGQNAGQFFNQGMQSYQANLGQAQGQKYQNAQDYQTLQGLQTGVGASSMPYSQQIGGINAQAAAQMRVDQARPRGGGGGAPPAWQQWGASSPQDFAAQQEAIRRQNQSWDWSNNPAYRQPSGPSYGAQVGGGLLGVGAGILGSYLGSKW